jgi:hypothetical protein
MSSAPSSWLIVDKICRTTCEMYSPDQNQRLLLLTISGDGYPTCTRCQKSSRECQRVETKWRFRHTIPAGSSPNYQALDSTPGVPVPPQTPNSPSLSRPRNRLKFHLPTHTLQGASLQTHQVPWPRISTRDACLLRYFTEDLSRWVHPTPFFISIHLLNTSSSTSQTPKGTLQPLSPNEPANAPPSSTPSSPSQHATSAPSPDTRKYTS